MSAAKKQKTSAVDEIARHLEETKKGLMVSISSQLEESSKNILKGLEVKINEIDAREEKWQNLMKLTEETAAKVKDKVKLDVGGKIFSTTKSTLLSHENNYFSAMLRSGHFQPGEDGSYFIDRDPKLFPLILNYLRYGQMETAHLNEKQKEKLRAEIDYYQIEIEKPIMTFVAQNAHYNYSDGNTTVERVADSFAGILCNSGWNTGVHQWKIILNEIEDSEWIAIGVAPWGAADYQDSYSISSQNLVYLGATRTAPCMTGNWRQGDTVECTLDCERRSFSVELQRTTFVYTITDLPRTNLFPFIDASVTGVSATIQSMDEF